MAVVCFTFPFGSRCCTFAAEIQHIVPRFMLGVVESRAKRFLLIAIVNGPIAVVFPEGTQPCSSTLRAAFGDQLHLPLSLAPSVSLSALARARPETLAPKTITILLWSSSSITPIIAASCQSRPDTPRSIFAGVFRIGNSHWNPSFMVPSG